MLNLMKREESRMIKGKKIDYMLKSKERTNKRRRQGQVVQLLIQLNGEIKTKESKMERNQ